MSNNRYVIFLALPDQISDVKDTDEQAGNIDFISIECSSTNNLPRSPVVVCQETLPNKEL
jgi:hypothetical protein